MRSAMHSVVWVGVAFVASVVITCGGSSDNKCVPGRSTPCSGPAGCAGSQECKADGTYAACACATSDGGVLPDGALDEAGFDANMDDSASDGSGSFSVKSLPGLALWLDTSVGLVPDPNYANRVKRWSDQSGNANDATNGMGCTAPCTWTVDSKVVNGHDAIRVPINDGASIADSPTLRWGTGDWAILMVLNPGGGGNQPEPLWLKDGNVFQINTLNAGYRLICDGQLVNVQPPDIAKWHVFYARGKKLDLNAGGNSSSGQATTSDLSAAGSDVIVFSRAGMQVAEVIAVKGTLSDGDLAKTVAYLKTKYALP